MIILRINRYVARLLSGLSEHRRVLHREDDCVNRTISRRTNRYSSSSIILSPILRNESTRNRTWLMNHQNSRVFRWMMIRMMRRYHSTSQLCTSRRTSRTLPQFLLITRRLETLEQSCFSSRLHRDTGQWVLREPSDNSRSHARGRFRSSRGHSFSRREGG